MRTRVARVLRRLAAKLDPPPSGVEIGRRWAEEMAKGSTLVLNHSFYSADGLPKTLTTKVMLDAFGQLRGPTDGK